MMVMMAFVVLFAVMVCMTLSIMLLLQPFHMDIIHWYLYDKWKHVSVIKSKIKAGTYMYKNKRDDAYKLYYMYFLKEDKPQA